MISFHDGFEATRLSHEAEVRRKAEDARKLAAFDDLLATAEAYALAVTMHCDHQYAVVHEFTALAAAIKKARTA